MVNIEKFIPETIEVIARYLEQVLPEIYEDWWEEGVIESLSLYQKKMIQTYGKSSLRDLDLAALLRVFDENWYQIKNKENFPYEYRHYLKEMKSIRNKWAHRSGNESDEDIYRDLDTMCRFLEVISSDRVLIDKINEEKRNIVNSIAGKGEETGFYKGQIVYLRSDPDLKGAVVDIKEGGEEDRIKVFMNGEFKVLYSSQLIGKEDEKKDLISWR